MRILFVNPPNCGRSIPEERYGIDSLKQIFRGEPLALEVLAGNLPDHEVRILDLKVEPDRLAQELRCFAPHLVGLTAMTCEAKTVLSLARQIKQTSSAKVVVGGVHASCDPEFFNRSEIDWIVIGLGAQSLRELVDALISGKATTAIPGVAPTCQGKTLRWTPRHFSQSDRIGEPAPRYDLVAHYREHYTLPTLGLQMGFVATAAGCPHDCSFCCIASLTGGRYLTAASASVLRDLKTLEQSPVVRLVDANSFGNPAQSRQLVEAIAAAGIRKQYLADIRADTVVRQPELLKRWKEVGLRGVIVGFEEICDARLGRLNKASSAATNREAIGILHDLGLTIVGDFIIAPDYDEAQFDKLGAFVREQQIELPMYTILTPLPGTRLHRQLSAQISIQDLDYYTLTNAVLPTRLKEELFYQRYAALLREGHSKARV